MTAGLDCPSYLSSRSADVILSDVRPIRLAPAALRALNVFLDELLWIVLANARSLSTDRLHGALRKVLPTSLGKEALLEAEVELRAYLEKTPPLSGALDKEEFNLQYAFELLRIKCEAYATLNDQDEDTDAEAKLHEQNAGTPSPKPTLLAPAALYLTAILECICEHILSIVGRVAARDSSRTSASVQDLFVALCEDASIFGLFKVMKVYAQIEAMTQEPTHQRRKSLSQPSDRSPSRTGSPGESIKAAARRPSVTSIKGRISSDSKRNTRAGSPALRRSSVEKARAFAELVAGPALGRSSSDRSEQERPRMNAEANGVAGSDRSDPEDDAGLDFDEALRSGSTVKVSLTPDRLRSMEAYKQGRRGGSKLASELSPIAPSDEERTPISPQPGSTGRTAMGSRRPSAPQVPQVASIKEDDEDPAAPSALLPSAPIPVPRPRNTSLEPSKPNVVPHDLRKRTMSAAAPVAPRGTDLFAPKPKFVQQPPQLRMKSEPNAPPSAFPPKRRQVAKRRESLDLDDIMNGSDEEDGDDGEGQDVQASALGISTPRRGPDGAPSTPKTPRTPGVSTSTRDLMDFLQSGPPEDPHPSPSSSVPSSAKKDRNGRFQKMMSRLTRAVSQEQLNKRVREEGASIPPTPPLPASALGNGAFAGASRLNVNGTTVIAFKPPRPPRPPPVEPMPSVVVNAGTSSASTGTPSLSRAASTSATATPSSAATSTPALPLSPPASPSVLSLVDERAKAATPSISVAQVPTPPGTSGHARRMSIQRKAVPVWDEELGKFSSRPTSLFSPQSSMSALHTPEPSGEISSPEPVPRVQKDEPVDADSVTAPAAGPSKVELGTVSSHTLPAVEAAERLSSPSVEIPPTPAHVPSPNVDARKPMIAVADLEDFRHLMSRATTAEECRLLLDMFLLRSGVALFPSSTEFAVPYPSPVASDGTYMPLPSAPLDGAYSPTEFSIVEHLLGGGASPTDDEETFAPATPIYKLDGTDSDGISLIASVPTSPAVPSTSDTFGT